MKKAFTLAEVLITLTIIGVIAALTVPNLMRKWSDHADVQRVKEAYSILDNVIKLVIRENNVNDLSELSWPYPNGGEAYLYAGSNSAYFLNLMKGYLKMQSLQYRSWTSYNLTKSVKTDTNIEAYPLYQGRYAQLPNGMTIGLWIPTPHGYADYLKVIGRIAVDINGYQKGPNRSGYDIFHFQIYVDGLRIDNGKAYRFKNAGDQRYCCYKDDISASPKENGLTCSSWVLRKVNMDYKYRDVSAEW